LNNAVFLNDFFDRFNKNMRFLRLDYKQISPEFLCKSLIFGIGISRRIKNKGDMFEAIIGFPDFT